MCRRLPGWDRLGEDIESQLPTLHQIAQVAVAGHQLLETAAFVAAQRAECVFGRELIAQFGVSVVHRYIQSLSRSRLSRTQLFTVPRGRLKRPAASWYVMPS